MKWLKRLFGKPTQVDMTIHPKDVTKVGKQTCENCLYISQGRKGLRCNVSSMPYYIANTLPCNKWEAK